MIYRLANESDLEALSLMRWLHEYEEGCQSKVTKDEFINHCKAFLENGIKSKLLKKVKQWAVENQIELLNETS